MQLFVEKDTDMMRSTFVAIGLGNLMYQLAPIHSGQEIYLRNLANCYVIEIPYDRDTAHAYLQQRGLPQIIPALIKEFSAGELKEIQKNPASPIQYKYLPRGFPKGAIADYKTEKMKIDAARAEKNYGKGIITRHNDYPLWAHLCSYFGRGSVMRSVYPTTLHTWWAHQKQSAHQLLDLILKLYSEIPNNYSGAVRYWSDYIQPQLFITDIRIMPLVTASSVISPTTVQGNNRVAVGLNMNNESLETFWLEIYLALAGYMVVGMPYRTRSDVVLYYPIPNNISISKLNSDMGEYRKHRDVQLLYNQYNVERGKLDALAYLNYYQISLERIINQKHNIIGNEDGDLIGLVGYYYKDNGGTQIPFDETTFALPHWLNLHHPNSALELLQDHKQIISSIRGPHYELTGDELAIIAAYRQFIITGESEAWIEFAVRYNLYQFRKMDIYIIYLERSILEFFEETLMALKPDQKGHRLILHNRGFQAIASAIRACTVTERFYQKVQNRSRPFKVRHGLGNDLLRHAHDSKRFLEILTNFVHDYARESRNVQANTGEIRAVITEDHIAEIIRLINDYGSRLIAQCLIAMGYASDYRRSR